MSEASIKIRKNGGRGNVTPGECINLFSPLNPGGARGVKFGTNMQGGDGSLEFFIRDPGSQTGCWPAIKNDGAEVYYGNERVTQHSVNSHRRSEAEAALYYACRGHDPHYEKTITLTHPLQDIYVVDWIVRVVYDPGNSWIQAGAPFISDSQRYCLWPGGVENPLLQDVKYDAATGEQIMQDMLKHNDWIRGGWPGRVADPDDLGCFFYYHKRGLDYDGSGPKVKWHITKEDLALIPGGGFKVEDDWSNYCNYVTVKYKYDVSGNVTSLVVQDAASQAKYTQGSSERYTLDLTGMKGYLSSAQATQAGQTWLDIFARPQAKGSIVVPLKPIRRTAGGMRWAGFVRGGDIVKVEHDEHYAFDENDPIDNVNGFLVDATAADLDAGINDLKMPESVTMEDVLTQTLAA